MSLCEKTRAAAKRYKPTKMYIYQCFTRFNFHGNITEWDWMIRIQFAGAGVKLAGKGLMCNQEFVDDDYYLDSVCHIETADFMIDIGETAAELTAEIF